MPPNCSPTAFSAAVAGRFGLSPWLAIAMLVPFSALALLVRAHWTPLRTLDEATVSRLHAVALANQPFVLAMRAVSRAGSGPYYWGVGLVVIGWLFYRYGAAALPTALLITIGIGGSQWLNLGAKDVVARARPALSDPVAHAGGLSFPSGHAQAAAVSFGLLVVLPWRALDRRRRGWLITVALLAVLTIGFSRVALGVHYPSDVVGGYLLGVAWLGVLFLVFGLGRRPGLPIPTKRTVV